MPKAMNCRLETNLIIKGDLYKPGWKEMDEWKADICEKLEEVIKEVLSDFLPEAKVEFKPWSKR